MFRVTLRVERVPADIARQAADDIAAAFQQRPWQEKVCCRYEDGGLTFTSENDFDSDGLATRDEFAHEFSSNVQSFVEDDGNLRVFSVVVF